MAPEHQEEDEVKVRGHSVKEGPVSVCLAESHPVHEQVGSVGLSHRYDAVVGCLH